MKGHIPRQCWNGCGVVWFVGTSDGLPVLPVGSVVLRPVVSM